MKCLKCGKELRATDSVCPKCGTRVQNVNSNAMQNNNLFTYEKFEDNDKKNNAEFNSLQNSSNNQQNYNKQNYNQQNYNQANYSQQNNNQQNYNQQNYNQPNNYQTNNTNPQQNQMNYEAQQSKRRWKTVVIIIIVVLIIALLVGGIVFFVRKVNRLFKELIVGSALQSAQGVDGNDEISQAILEEILSGGSDVEGDGNVLNITSGNNDEVKLDKDNTEPMDLDGFRFYIPNNLERSVDEKGIVIRDTDKQWFALLEVTEGDLVDEMQDSMMRNIAIKLINAKQTDIKITNSATVTVNGIDYVLLEGEHGGDTLVLAFAQLNSEYMVEACITATDGNLALATVSEIVKNVEPIED